MYDLVIVGGGPAGLTAAVYAVRKRLNFLLVSEDLGGKTNFRLDLPDVESYQVVRGSEVVDKFKRELEYLDFAHQLDKVEKIERGSGDGFVVHTKSGARVSTRAVIIATGARQELLNVPGERDYLSRGLCYSALSYAPLFIDRKTAVIGEGELALRSAAELATVASHVAVVGPLAKALESPLGRKLSQSGNVTILQGYRVKRVEGNGYCSRLVVEDPEGVETTLDADGTFVEKALIPNSRMLAGLVNLDDKGFVQVDKFGRTSVPGIFAAGDVTDGVAEQVLTAVGDGVKAVLSAYEYLLPVLKL